MKNASANHEKSLSQLIHHRSPTQILTFHVQVVLLPLALLGLGSTSLLLAAHFLKSRGHVGWWWTDGELLVGWWVNGLIHHQSCPIHHYCLLVNWSKLVNWLVNGGSHCLEVGRLLIVIRFRKWLVEGNSGLDGFRMVVNSWFMVWKLHNL